MALLPLGTGIPAELLGPVPGRGDHRAPPGQMKGLLTLQWPALPLPAITCITVQLQGHSQPGGGNTRTREFPAGGRIKGSAFILEASGSLRDLPLGPPGGTSGAGQPRDPANLRVVPFPAAPAVWLPAPLPAASDIGVRSPGSRIASSQCPDGAPPSAPRASLGAARAEVSPPRATPPQPVAHVPMVAAPRLPATGE
jgi:hypothetical protein